MNKHSSKITIIISASLVLILAIALNSCRYSDRKFYKTHTGNVVTIWDGYVIFEKYTGKETPKNNYIRLKDMGGVSLFFKKNDSIIVFKRSGKNTVDIGFNKPDYKYVIYGNTWNEYQEFQRTVAFSDTLITFGLSYYPYDKIVTISECIDETVYTRDYGRWPIFYKEFVYSRYDKSFDNRAF